MRPKNVRLGRGGFLTGSIIEQTTFDASDTRTMLPRFTPEARKANQPLVPTICVEALLDTRRTTYFGDVLGELPIQVGWCLWC